MVRTTETYENPSWLTSINANILSGEVPSANLPSYVDDVLEYDGTGNFPAEGATGKIYLDTSTNFSYRWGGSTYVQIVDGKATWGGIDGTLSNQTDLQNALNNKADTTYVNALSGLVGQNTASGLQNQTDISTLSGLIDDVEANTGLQSISHSWNHTSAQLVSTLTPGNTTVQQLFEGKLYGDNTVTYLRSDVDLGIGITPTNAELEVDGNIYLDKGNAGRPVTIYGDALGFLSKKGDSGGWQFSVDAEGHSGTIYKGYGFYGSDDDLLWLWVGGSYDNPYAKFTTSETVFNETAQGRDFRVEGEAETHLLFADASKSNVGIGQSAPKSRLTVTADANDEYVVRLGNAAGGGGSVTGVSKLGLDHWTPSLNHPAVALSVEEITTSNYSANLHIQLRTAQSDTAPETKFTFTRDGYYGIGTDSPACLLHIKGESTDPAHILLEDTSSSLKTRIYNGNSVSVLSVDETDSLASSSFIVQIDGSNKATFGTSTTTFDQSLTVNAINNQAIIGNTTTVFNEGGNDIDFRVEGLTNENLFLVDASTDGVIIGNSTDGGVNSKLHIYEVNNTNTTNSRNPQSIR